MTPALAKIIGVVFRVPQALGFGDHWPLPEDQCLIIARDLDACIKSIPTKARARTINTLTKWLPWGSLIVSAYYVTQPRVLMTQNSLRVRREYGNTETGSPRTTRAPANGPGETEPHSIYDGVPTWADVSKHVRH